MNETAIAHVSPGAIVGQHQWCGGEIVVTDEAKAVCEKCGTRYGLALKAELTPA